MQIYQISWIWLRNILQKVKFEKAIKDMEKEIEDKEEKLEEIEEEIDGYKDEIKDLKKQIEEKKKRLKMMSPVKWMYQTRKTG